MKDRTNSTFSFAILLYILQWLTQNPFGCVRRCCCLSRNIMFPATSQVKLLIAQLNIILTAVLPTKQEHTILRESFPNKGSYNFVQSKQLTHTPSPLPFGMHLTHVGMMMMSLSVSISYINTQPIKCVTISTCKKHWSGLNISHSVMTAILCIQWFDTQVLIFFILFHD